MTDLRKLDIDDIYILKHLHDGLRLSEISEKLCLSAPAITARTIKIEAALGNKILDRSTRKRFANEYGLKVSEVCSRVVELLETINV